MMDLKNKLIQRNAEIGKWVFEWRNITEEELHYCPEIEKLIQEIQKVGNEVLIIGMTNVKAPDTNYFTKEPIHVTPAILNICQELGVQIKIENDTAVDIFCPKHYAVLRYDKNIVEVLSE